MVKMKVGDYFKFELQENDIQIIQYNGKEKKGSKHKRFDVIASNYAKFPLQLTSDWFSKLTPLTKQQAEEEIVLMGI